MRSAPHALLLVSFVAGCATTGSSSPEPLAPVLTRVRAESGRIRGTASLLAGAFTQQARALQKARAAGKETESKARLASLEAYHLALEALDEAEGTLAVVSRYASLRGALRVPDAVRKRLDQTAGEMVDVARALHRHATLLVAATRARDEPAAAGARTEIERDRAALKAYRTDLGVSARLFNPGARPR